MKESLSAIPKQPVFRETFTDEQTTRLNGGTIETPITFTNGVANFTPSAKGVLYNFTPKLFSVRIKFSNRIVNAQDNYLFGSFTDTKYVLILNNNNIYGGLASWSAVYINGVASTSLGTLTSGEITVTGFSNYTATSFRVGGKNTVGLGFEGSLELVEIYDYTLTANEVKNLYEGKRNRIIDLKQTAPSSANYYYAVQTTGNYCLSSLNYNTSDWDVEFKINGKYASVQDRVVSTRTSGNGATVTVNATSINFEYSIATVFYTATALVTNINDVDYTIRVTRNSATGAVTFIRNGVTLTTTGVQLLGTLDGVSNLIEINGSLLGVQAINAKIYYCNLYIGGNIVRNFNPQLYVGGTTLPSSTGETWTIVGTQGFIGNGSRPEILNIDGRNGVIANKYSGGVASVTNLVTNGDFATDTWWQKSSTNVNISNGTGNYTAGTIEYFWKAGLLTVGKRYKVTLSCTSFVSGYLNSYGGNWSGIIVATGTYTYEFTAIDTAFGIVGNTFIGSIDNVILQEIVPNIVNTAVTPVRQGSVWGMDFNGSTSKLDCGNYDSLLGDITFIAWYKAATLGSGSAGRIIDNGQMQIHSGGYFTRNSSTFINFISAWKLGIWTQVVITSTSTGLTNTYINGVLVGSANQNAGSPVAGSNNILLGNNNSSNRCFNGKGSQIRIIKGILNAQECQQLFDNERHDYGI